jgi:hypothetical protein
MKKILLSLAVLVGLSFAASANSYKLNNNHIEATYAAATDVTTILSNDAANLMGASSTEALALTRGGSYTKGGFLVRAFFCGIFSMHRTYMGGKFQILYCIPGIWIVPAIDFWYVLLSGDDALSKYSGNDKFWVLGD